MVECTGVGDAARGMRRRRRLWLLLVVLRLVRDLRVGREDPAQQAIEEEKTEIQVGRPWAIAVLESSEIRRK